MTETGSGIALCLVPLAALCSQWLRGCDLSCSLPYKRSACSSITGVPGAHGGSLEQLPLCCMAASSQSSEEATKPTRVDHRTCRAPAQLRAPGVVALGPRSVSAHVHACDFRNCLSPSARSSLVLMLHRWPRLSSTVPRARLRGLQPPPTAARTRSSTAGSPVHAHPPFPQDGHIL